MIPAVFQVLFAFLMVSVLALVTENPFAVQWNADALIAVVWLGLLGSGVAYLLMFRLLSRIGATATSQLAYLLPVVGIITGAIMFGEAVDARTWSARADPRWRELSTPVGERRNLGPPAGAGAEGTARSGSEPQRATARGIARGPPAGCGDFERIGHPPIPGRIGPGGGETIPDSRGPQRSRGARRCASRTRGRARESTPAMASRRDAEISRPALAASRLGADAHGPGARIPGVARRSRRFAVGSSRPGEDGDETRASLADPSRSTAEYARWTRRREREPIAPRWSAGGPERSPRMGQQRITTGDNEPTNQRRKRSWSARSHDPRGAARPPRQRITRAVVRARRPASSTKYAARGTQRHRQPMRSPAPRGAIDTTADPRGRCPSRSLEKPSRSRACRPTSEEELQPAAGRPRRGRAAGDVARAKCAERRGARRLAEPWWSRPCPSAESRRAEHDPAMARAAQIACPAIVGRGSAAEVPLKRRDDSSGKPAIER